VIGSDLALVVEANGLGGHLECGPDRFVDRRQGIPHLVGSDDEGAGAGAVEALTEFEDRLVTAAANVGDDRTDDLEGSVLVGITRIGSARA
jgi:hypothetical protein